MQPLPFERAYWVVPGNFLAGYYPGYYTKEEAQDRVRNLLTVGIRCFLNLIEENEARWVHHSFVPYANLLMDMAQDMGVDVTYVHIPIRGMQAPARSTMRVILDTVDSAIRNAQPVYVHCWAGIGRTGTVVGCYLARHGIAVGETVLAKIQHLRTNEAMAHLVSPESEEQRQYVCNWHYGQ